MLSPSFNCPIAEKQKQTLFIVSNAILYPIHGKSLLLYWCVLQVFLSLHLSMFWQRTIILQTAVYFKITLQSGNSSTTPTNPNKVWKQTSPSYGDITRLTCLPRKIRSTWHMFSKQHGWSFGWNRSTLGAARHGDCLFHTQSHRTNCSPALSLESKSITELLLLSHSERRIEVTHFPLLWAVAQLGRDALFTQAGISGYTYKLWHGWVWFVKTRARGWKADLLIVVDFGESRAAGLLWK